MLWGEVVDLKDKGLVVTKEYGTYHFKPIFILNDDNGRRLADDLGDLIKKYNEDKDSLSNVYKKLMEQTLEKYGQAL